jgi:prepilin-type N-terminal cleavage/methylation domain-containing protein
MSAAGKSDRGFTLLEGLVVIAIVAMIAAIIAPNIGASLDLLSLRQSTSTMQADLRVARATAMRTGNPVTMKPLPLGRGYDWIGGTRHLPGNITLSMSGPISFMADGSMMAATVALTSGSRKIPLAIDATTGAVTAGGR